MKLILVLSTVALALASAAENQLTPQEKSAGWRLLFDGTTMTGWTDSVGKPMAGDAWAVENGCLKPRAKPTFTEDLYSKDKFTDFELDFDWRISPAGNSGVKYRIQDHIYMAGDRAKGKPRKFEVVVDDFSKNRITERPTGKGQDYVVGFEYQVIDNSANADALSAQTHSAGALYDIAAPSKDATKLVGEWNHSRLIVKGSHVEHWLNGEKVVDTSIAPDVVRPLLSKRWGQTPHVLTMLSDQPNKSCPISLQNHGDEAWFRNIKIKNL
jgi:Domain of Unknown Function (DUF1080)